MPSRMPSKKKGTPDCSGVLACGGWIENQPPLLPCLAKEPGPACNYFLYLTFTLSWLVLSMTSLRYVRKE